MYRRTSRSSDSNNFNNNNNTTTTSLNDQLSFLPGGSSNHEADPVALLEEEYDALTSEEKDTIREGLYGNRKEETETEDFVAGKLKELKHEINCLSEEVNRHYLQAVRQEEENEIQIRNASRTIVEETTNYVRSSKFHLLFLRVDNYDAKFAARRITRYFTEKGILFGEEKLSKLIRQRDLNELDLRALYLGGHIDTGVTDAAGRHIFVVNKRRVLNHNVINVKRAMFYLFSSFVEAQPVENNIVLIVQDQKRKKPNETQDENEDSIVRWGPFHAITYAPLQRFFTRALPIRVDATHVFYYSTLTHMYMTMVLKILPKAYRRIVLLHYIMQPKEMNSILRKYGIHYAALPLNEQGRLQNDQIKSYLDRKRHQEEETTIDLEPLR